MRPIKWDRGRLSLLDQRALPEAFDYFVCESSSRVYEAIKKMVVRGAPAIGVAAAYGLVLASKEADSKPLAERKQYIIERAEFLKSARPTAINLSWSLNLLLDLIRNLDAESFTTELEKVALRLDSQDYASNVRMGEMGSTLFEERVQVLTHCNAGSLATTGYGTALGVIRSGCKKALISKVYATETRPWFQGSRLTITELREDDIEATLITDSAAGFLMARSKIDWVIVGADRVAINGDVANKIGTYGLAILAKYHNTKFMVVAPTSTLDISAKNGGDIPIEYREAEEITKLNGEWLARPQASALNPVFDVTPASLVDALVTEKGVILEPTEEKICSLLAK